MVLKINHNSVNSFGDQENIDVNNETLVEKPDSYAHSPPNVTEILPTLGVFERTTRMQSLC